MNVSLSTRRKERPLNAMHPSIRVFVVCVLFFCVVFFLRVCLPVPIFPCSISISKSCIYVNEKGPDSLYTRAFPRCAHGELPRIYSVSNTEDGQRDSRVCTSKPYIFPPNRKGSLMY